MTPVSGEPDGRGDRRIAASGMAVWRAVATIIAGVIAAGVASWLWPASLHIIAWPKGGPHRVAVFAPLTRLWLLLGIAATTGAVAAVVLFRCRPTASSPQAGEWPPITRVAHVFAPLNLFWTWTVPFWPWLPDRLPLLVAGAGPVRWVIAALALGGVLVRTWRLTGARISAKRFGTERFTRRPRALAFFLALAFYTVLGIPAVTSIGLGGDEPHYLVITQSLLADGDLKIEDNHARGEHRRFFNGDLRPDYLQRGTNGEIYSIHAPGLSALLLPGYAAAGRSGAVLTIILLAALTALAVFDLAQLAAPGPVAWLTWTAVVATVPMVPHAWALYPEIAGAVLVAWAMVWLTGELPQAAAAWLWRGMMLAALPWLHTKFSVLLAGLALLLSWRLRRQPRAVAALLAPIGLVGIAWLGFFYAIYGRFDPQAPYGGYAAQFVRFANLPRSLLGLLFDQKFGLLVYAPVYALAATGVFIRSPRREWRLGAYGAVVLAIAYVVSSARLYMWWGGSSAPARFLVPVIPLLVMPLAWGMQRPRGRAATVAWTLAGAASVAVAVAGALGASHLLLFSVPHGVARIIELVEGSAPLSAVLPTFTSEDWQAPVRLLVPWLAAGGLALAAGKAAAGWTRSFVWIGATQLLVLGVAGAALHPSFAPGVRAAAATRGALALLDRFDPLTARAFDYTRATRLRPDEWLALLRVTFDREPGSDPDPQGRLTDALVLPPGVYDARVWFEGGDRTRPGALQAALGNGYLLARRDEPLTNPSTLALSVPIAVPSLWLQLSDPAAARAVRRVELSARDVRPAGQRAAETVRTVEAFPERLQAYVAYVNDHAYPERGVFWTRGTGQARLRLAPAGAATLVLTVHVGPLATNVHLQVGSTVQRLELAAEETREVRVVLPPGEPSILVEVSADRFFVPAEVDPSSTDIRQLGCQVRLVLE